MDLLKNKKLKTPDTVRHICVKCFYGDRINILADVVVKYGGMESATIIFCDTKRDANDILLNANIKVSC